MHCNLQKSLCFYVGESFAKANGVNQTILMTNTGKSPVSFNMTVTPRGIGSVTGAPRTGEPPSPPSPNPSSSPMISNILVTAAMHLTLNA